jgi:protein-S-isoprenylcysteine O-methyltransferase Ste14
LFFRVIFSAFWLIFFSNLVWVSRATRRSAGIQTTQQTRKLRVAALALAVFYFGGALLYALLPSWIVLFSIPLPDWLRLTMIAVGAFGISFVVWGVRTIGKNWAPSLSGIRKDSSLVTSGPYGAVRHPIYSGAFFLLAALALLSANWFILLPTLALLILLYTQIGEEEAILIGRFGDEYREYMKRTPRFIPRFGQKTRGRPQPP